MGEAARRQQAAEYALPLSSVLVQHLTKTARRLDVHINTVKNRIAKAEECLSCDLDDENVRFALRADMVSLAYLKHIDAL